MNVHLQYSPDLPEALTGISFELRPGQKVGICGRTGEFLLKAACWQYVCVKQRASKLNSCATHVQAC